MTKNTPLSSDIDVIKEFEELKLKQKLLIESLKRNENSTQNKLFLEINSKLDFLVKIFTEANSNHEEEKQTNYEDLFNNINEKLDKIENNFNDKLNLIEKKIDNIDNSPKITNKLADESINTDNSDNKTNEQIVQANKIEKSNEHKAPLPSFEAKIDELKEEPKKKGWFS